MTEEEQQRIIDLGLATKALKSNQALEACMTSTLNDLFGQWCNSTTEEAARRESLWHTAQALLEFKATVDSFISTGQLEEANRAADHVRYNFQ